MYPPASVIRWNSSGHDGLWSFESYRTFEVASICTYGVVIYSVEPWRACEAVAWITESDGCNDSEHIALLSPTFNIHISSLTTRMTMAHDPALLCCWSGDGAAIFKKSSSVFQEPFLMAVGMSEGNSGCKITLLCKLSLRYSAHLLPPCPS